MSGRCQNFPANCRIMDAEQIVAGVKLSMTYLNAGEKLKFGGSDDEIAQVLHNAYVGYKKYKIKEACKVSVFINHRFIDIYDHVSNEILLTFRLIDVKDITRGLDRYSKLSVLVAKETKDTSLKAYIFHSKEKPAFFHDIVISAFQLGFSELKRAGSTSQYLQSMKTNDCLPRLNMYSMNNRGKINYTNYALYSRLEDISDSDDEFQWQSNKPR